MKKVVVEEGVTRIGDSAFYLCRSLEKITLAKTVTSVGFEVIAYCENLSTATSYFGVQKATYLGTNDNPYYALVEITDDSPWGNSEEYPTFTLNVTSGCVVISDFLYAYANTYDFGVKMPDSVLYIGQRALMSCKSFNLPKNLITIGEYAFAYSDHAGDIKIPSTVKSVGENAFSDCDNLQFVEIPDTMTSIPYGMFYDCNGLRKVTFGGNLESIGAQAFYYCDGLTSLSIPDSVTQIGYGAFEQCRGLTTVRVGTGLKKSESRAFFNCIAIKHVYIKDMAAWCDIDFADSDANPYIYAEYLYLNGTLLDHIVIPEGVTKIGAYAFTSYWMNRLQVQKLTIPASVKSVSDSAFANCSIRHIYISDLKAWCDLSTGKNGFITIAPSYLYLNGEMVTHLEVPEGVISLRPNAFRYLGGIEKVTLPQSLETIGQWAFYCCPDLKEITIADGVTQIGEYAFDYGVCERSIRFLGDAPALAGSPGVSNKVTYICYNSDAKGWTEEYKALWRDAYTWVPDHSVSGYTSDGNGTCTEDGTQTGNCQYCGASVTILQPSVGHTPGEWITTEEATPEHNGVKQRRCTVCDELLETAEINRCAFGTCGENLSWYLDLVTGELTVSGSGAMVSGSDTAIPWVSYRDRITVAVLEEGVTTIGAAAFNKCENLTAVHLPDTLTTIEEYAFFGCCALTDVDLPASLTRLDNHVFANCASLTEISIVQGVTELKSNVFQECDQLVAVHLPVSLTHIGEKAFFGCDRLEEIRLPANVKTLGNHSFYKCVSLTSVTIGEGVTEIGSYAFYNCTSLKEIVFEGNAPTLAADALKNVVATAVYPAKAEGWEQASASSYGGTISWLAKEQTVPTILLKYPTVSFEDEIVMNIYFDASDLEDVVEMGLLTYDAEVDTADITSADAVIPGYAFRDREQLFCAVSRGIAAKDMEKPLYFAVYAKLKDGTYVYTAPASYAPSTYAANLLTNGSGQMRSLMAATLSYGGAAQKYFGSNGTLSDLDRTLIESYREDMMNAVVQPDADKIGDFSGTGGFSKGYPTVSFEGAFAIRYYFTPANGVASDVQLYYWTAEDYDQAQTLTADNATGILTMEAGAEGYQAAVEGIAAKDLDDTVYVACVYSDGTNDWCSGVLAYSIGAYCTAQAAKTGALAELAAATAVYGYYARQLLD